MMIEEKVIDNKEIEQRLEQLDKKITDYIDENILNEFFAYYLKTAYELNLIFQNSNLEYEYKDALDYFRFHDMSKLDINKLNKILKEQYSLEITNTSPINIDKK